jgi:two-component system LytT family sensor kinase
MKKLINRERVILYLCIGMAFLLVWTFYSIANHPETLPGRILNEVWRVIYLIAANYFFFEYSLPRMGRKHIVRTILLIAAQVFIFTVGLYAWRALGIRLGIHTPYIIYPSTHKTMEAMFSAGMTSLFFFGIIRHIYGHIKLRQAAQQLRIEKQQAELNYLKSQTNPHFLFNTLNNIYSLARDKSDLAPESVLRLSKILRFMLYETSGDYIAIEQELKIISDYIALESLRYDESLLVNFNHDIEDMRQALPPLLLIPLVENAFKHGVSETRNRPFVDIHLSVNQRQLKFVVKNSTEAEKDEVVLKENIGLSNLRRQLELLYKDYNLSVQQGDYVFTATLKINLASHV